MLNPHPIIQENETFLLTFGQDLQANIFVSRRKTFVEMLFLHLEADSDRIALSEVLANLARNSETGKGIHLTSYQNQLDIKTAAQHQKSLFCNLYLSSDGFSKLLPKAPHWQPIVEHLAGNRADLDWDLPHWDPNYKGDKSIDAVLVLAHNTRDALPRMRRSFVQEIFPRVGVELLFVEEARVYRNNLVGNNRERGLVVEHFGYADGASNPCVTEREFQRFSENGKSMNEWNPVSSWQEFVVEEPTSFEKPSYGSYLVLRKLRQHVEKFNSSMQELAAKLSVAKGTPVSVEEVGALAFGRRRNGTSIEKDSNYDNKTLNDFHYPEMSKCPFFAHARKMNPREVESWPGLPRSYQHPNPIMRRGVTYGKRRLRYGGLDTSRAPDSEVGLLFLSFQKDIGRYQQILQNSWSDDNLDPILGNLDDPNRAFIHQIPDLTEPHHGFGGFVDLKGGLNLFAPSLSFFKNLSIPVI